MANSNSIKEQLRENLERRTLKEAELLLKGMSLSKIAKQFNVSRITVHRDLTIVLNDINPKLAKEVYQKLRENHATIEDEFVRERVLKAYFYLTANNLNTIQIAELLGTSKYIIYRDLTTHLTQMSEKYPSVVSEEMLANVQRILTEHSINNIQTKKTSSL